jgi:hypothetical protein
MKVVLITTELRDVLYNYLNTKPRAEVNDMCMALEENKEIELQPNEDGTMLEANVSIPVKGG